jgi:hypothetical protein
VLVSSTGRIVKLWRLQWAGNLASMRYTRKELKIWWRNLPENFHVEDQEGDGELY